MKTVTTWLNDRRLLVALLVAFVLLGSLYSVVTPLFEASDELWHYPMVKTLADGNGLPIQNAANPGPWRQEGSQPPLYYALGALTTFWIDTSDINEVRRLNPHVDNGIVTEDGNNNLIVHNAAKEAWPWQGTTLAAHLVRLLSVLFSTGTVYFTYRIGEEVFPQKRWLALAGAAAVAFTPMFVFISGSVNNDNLAVLLATAAVWMMLRIVRQADTGQPTLRWALALGIVLGLAALSKQSTLGLFGLAGLSMAYAAWRQHRWQTLFLEGPLIVGTAAIVAGWWYWRNWQLYGDPTGLSTFLDMVGRRSPPASLLQLWGERNGFMASYWGLFGGVSVPMADWVYTVLNALAILSSVGIVIALVFKAQHDGISLTAWMPALLTLLWIPGVAAPLASGWARLTLASQGRLVFAAIGVLSLWFMAGLGAWLPERWGKVVVSGVVAFIAMLTIYAPFAWITPHYEVEESADIPPGNITYDFTPPGAPSPAMRLLRYSLETSETHPGGKVRLTLYWESLSGMDREWSVFVHLRDSTGLVISQRDTYPGLGLIATTDLEAGHRWADTYAVRINETAYSPETLQVQIGLYDLLTGQRMNLPDGSNALTLGQVSLLANERSDGIPNAISFNFGGEVELIGYILDTRQTHPGDAVTLTMYWRSLHPLSKNYTLSVQILDALGHNYGQQDNWLWEGEHYTSAWTSGQAMKIPWQVTLAPDTPPGIYNVQLVVYWVGETGNMQRLQLITSNGRLTDDFLLLTRIGVGE